MPVKKSKQTLADRVAEQLRLEILSGIYAPGDKLRPEVELATRFDVNRFTVREAMNKLEQMHLIKRHPGTGTVVLDYNEHASIDVLGDLVIGPDGRLNPFVVSHLLEAARVLSVEVCALAAERRNDSDLRKLCNIVTEMRIEKRLSKIASLDYDFHSALAGAAGNIVPRLVMNSVRDLLVKFSPLLETLYIATDSIVECYDHVVDAIKARDAERARSLSRWIWHFRHQRFVDLIEQHGRAQPLLA
ncbi:MAG TPA: FadR/GntR family transcriptional regulator [Polyangiaceae bacterium]|nr:FadR/GntR family transcriptional regulator [Polyangiaceae bacterium]